MNPASRNRQIILKHRPAASPSNGSKRRRRMPPRGRKHATSNGLRLPDTDDLQACIPPSWVNGGVADIVSRSAPGFSLSTCTVTGPPQFHHKCVTDPGIWSWFPAVGDLQEPLRFGLWRPMAANRRLRDGPENHGVPSSNPGPATHKNPASTRKVKAPVLSPETLYGNPDCGNAIEC